LLLGFASEVILGFESLMTTFYSPNMEGQVPVVITPRNRMVLIT
jgi:hypothetical protein